MVGCVLGGSGIKAASDVEALVNTSTEIWLVCIAEAGKLLTLVCRQCSLLGKLTISYRLVHRTGRKRIVTGWPWTQIMGRKSKAAKHVSNESTRKTFAASTYQRCMADLHASSSIECCNIRRSEEMLWYFFFSIAML